MNSSSGPVGLTDRSHIYRITNPAPGNDTGGEVNVNPPEGQTEQLAEALPGPNIDLRAFSNADVLELRAQTSYDMRQRSEGENDNLSRSVGRAANSQPDHASVSEMGAPDARSNAPGDENQVVPVIVVSNSSFFSSIVRTCGNALNGLFECLAPPLRAAARFFDGLFGRSSGSDYAPQPSPRDETRDIRAQRQMPTEIVIVRSRPVEPRPDSPGPQPILHADDDAAFKPMSIPK